MADIKWSAFPSIGALATGDVLVGLRAGANVRFSALTIPWTGENGGTGVANTGLTINLGSGASGYVLTSDSSGNGTWAAAGYLTGAVLLSPSSDQTIVNAHNLIMATGSMVAPTMLAGNLSLTSNTISSTNTNGNLYIQPNGVGRAVVTNTATPSGAFLGQFALVSVSASSSETITSYTANTGQSSQMYLAKSHSTTPGSFSAIGSSEVIGQILAFGDDGTQFSQSAAIRFFTDGTISNAVVPGQIQFLTSNSSGVPVQVLALNSDQQSAFAKGVTFGSSGVAGALTTYPSSASSGTLQLAAANNAGNFSNVLTNASTAAARTWALPDASGTIALTSGASGIVNSGTQNQLAWYAATGTTLSGLSTANNGILVTSAGGVPSIGNTVGAGLTMPSVTFNTTSGVIGTTTNDNAAGGSVGQLLSSTILAGSAIGLSTSTPTSLIAISLTAGDWDIWGNCVFTGDGTTLISSVISNIGPNANTLEDRSTAFVMTSNTNFGALQLGGAVPMFRVSVSSTTNYYLTFYGVFTISTLTGCGGLYARRRR